MKMPNVDNLLCIVLFLKVNLGFYLFTILPSLGQHFCSAGAPKKYKYKLKKGNPCDLNFPSFKENYARESASERSLEYL